MVGIEEMWQNCSLLSNFKPKYYSCHHYPPHRLQKKCLLGTDKSVVDISFYNQFLIYFSLNLEILLQEMSSSMQLLQIFQGKVSVCKQHLECLLPLSFRDIVINKITANSKFPGLLWSEHS